MAVHMSISTEVPVTK